MMMTQSEEAATTTANVLPPPALDVNVLSRKEETPHLSLKINIMRI